MKIDNMIRQIELYNSTGELPKMKELVDCLKEEAQICKSEEGLCAAYLFDGYLYSYDNQLEKANESTFQALEYADDEALEYYRMKAYNSLGANYVQMADYYSSLNYYIKALKIAKSKPEYNLSSVIYNNIGSLFSWIDESESAIHYLHLAFEDYLQGLKEDNYLFESIALNLAEAYTGVCGFQQIKALKNKYEQCFSENGKLEINIIYLHSAANYYAKNKQYEKAKIYIIQCMQSYQDKDNATLVYRCFLELFSITIQYNDLDLSKQLNDFIATIYQHTIIPAFSYRYAKLKVQFFETFFPYENEHKLLAYQMYYKESEAYKKQFNNTYVQNLKIALELDESKIQADTRQEENEFLQKEIEKDAFTNLLNKVYAQKYTEELMKKVDPSILQMFMIVDIDLFKLVNDEFGHTVGDDVILETSKRFKECIAKESVVARFGGDEFFAYTISKEGVAQIEEYVKNILAITNNIQFPNGVDRKQTYSIGVYMEYGCDDFEYAFKQADKALYLAKENGRNQAYMISDTLDSKVIKGE